ncbi:hypothetical protein PR003_g25199 [Phytophthora rubi]|uniref:RxLR effector protein n=1 Tax=Phytophthora rubi TaxID=129364 RepID=A0A6A3LR29_9STRA|nr:hypothetical protein PR002_g23239 [Phytophthora rubi]KAE9021786.1 hypothetical protein PR001_g13300 [Phytophthora rubi]KAE9290794.1 hypothetical protein PR003_g25199 [Phytophthora rubi]
MRTGVLLLLVAVASLATCSDFAVAEKAAPSHLKLSNSDNSPRNLKGAPETAKTDVDEEERGATQVISKLKSLLGKDPNKISEKKLEKVRSYAEKNPDKWYALSYYLDYIYGISFVALMGAGALWYGMRPAGMGGPKSN